MTFAMHIRERDKDLPNSREKQKNEGLEFLCSESTPDRE